GYTAAQHIFKRALRGIKQVEIYDHRERKGLHEEDNLQHVLQDSIPQEMIRMALPPEPEEPNKPVKVPECAICVIHPVTCDCDPEEYHDHSLFQRNLAEFHRKRNGQKEQPPLLNIHRKYLVFVNSKHHKHF